MKFQYRILFIFGVLCLSWNYAASQRKVACVGNSITFGYGLASPSTQSYPSRLQVLLGSSYAVSNFGVSARTMLKNGDRPYWNETQFTEAKALKPDVVIIMLGTNDAKLATNWTPHKDEFDGDYKAMIHAFRESNENAEFWVCKIVPAYKEIWEISNTIILNEVNPKIEQVAIDEGVHLIDMYSAMEDKSSLFSSDGIHPNASGAQAMADFIHSILLHDTIKIQQQGNSIIAPEAEGYQWYLNDNMVDETDGGKSRTLVAPANGTYKVAVKLNSTTGTILVSDTFVFETVTAIKSVLSEKVKVIYPNPCTNIFHIQLDEMVDDEYCLLLYNIAGECVKTHQFNAANKSENVLVGDLNSGLYLYDIKGSFGIVKSGKLIIRK